MGKKKQIKRQLVYHILKNHKNIDETDISDIDTVYFRIKGSSWFHRYTTFYLKKRLCLCKIEKNYMGYIDQLTN